MNANGSPQKSSRRQQVEVDDHRDARKMVASNASRENDVDALVSSLVPCQGVCGSYACSENMLKATLQQRRDGGVQEAHQLKKYIPTKELVASSLRSPGTL